MSKKSKKAPGASVSPEEINDLITKMRDIRAHLDTNRRHLDRIEKNMMDVIARVGAMLPEEETEPAAEDKGPDVALNPGFWKKRNNREEEVPE